MFDFLIHAPQYTSQMYSDNYGPSYTLQICISIIQGMLQIILWAQYPYQLILITSQPGSAPQVSFNFNKTVSSEFLIHRNFKHT